MSTNNLNINYFLFVFGVLVCIGTGDVPGIENRRLNPMLSQLGDISVAVLLQMTSLDDSTHQCGRDPVTTGCNGLEMAVFATQRVNSRSDLLPNITLGFVALDGCGNDMKSLEMVTYVLQDPDDGCPAAGNSTPPAKADSGFSTDLRDHRVFGLVLLEGSRVSVAISPLLGTFGIPQIGTIASSDDLSDNSRYRYFFRLVTPDVFQALGMLAVARHFGWKYVSVVYAQGSYGENGMKQLRGHLDGAAAGYGICIATAVMIPSLARQEDFDRIADQLVMNRDARVIIVYVENSLLIRPIFDSLKTKVGPKTFNLLGGDVLMSWEDDPIAEYSIIDGAIFLDNGGVPMPEFQRFLSTVTPEQSQKNTWILKLWENANQCTFDGVDFQNSSCSMNLSLDPSVCPVVPSHANRIHDAIVIFAQAAHMVIEENCPQEFSRRSDLKKCLHGDRILRKLVNGTFSGILGSITFTDTGDYMANLVVKQLVKIDNVTRSRIVGIWNTSEFRIFINDSMVRWDMFYNDTTSEVDNVSVTQPPVSVCSLPCRPKTYFIQKAVPCCWACTKCRSNEVILPARNGCTACPNFTWPDDASSTACLPIVPDYLRFSDAISLCMLCPAVILILIVLFCAAFFVIRRQNRLVKALSVQLSVVIFLGLVVVCLSVILFVVPADSTPVVCSARNVGFHVGICMVYAPLLVKNIRIYRIFANGRKSAKAPRFVSSEAQLIITFVFLTAQFVIVATSEILAAPVPALVMASPFEKYVELYCRKSTVWFLVPLAYNIAIMILCAAIGFVTRKLPNNFNESWFIFVSVSTTLFSWIVFIPAYFTVSQVHMQAAILGFALVLICIVTLTCQYVPVMYALLFVPKENVVTCGSSLGAVSTNATVQG